MSLIESGRRQGTAQIINIVAEALNVDPEVFRRRDEGVREQDRYASLIGETVGGVGDAANGDLVHATASLSRVIDAREAPPELVWQARCHLADVMDLGGRPDRSAELLKEALASLPPSMGADVEARLRARLARDERALGNIGGCIYQASTALELVTAANTQGSPEHAMALTQLIAGLSEAERLEEAAWRVAALSAVADSIASARLKALAHSAIAHALLRMGDSAQGLQYQRMALAELTCRDDPALWGRLRKAAATVMLECVPKCDLEYVESLLDEAERMLSMVGAPKDHMELKTDRALIALRRQDPQQAMRLLSQAAQQPVTRGFWTRARMAEAKAKVQWALGHRDEAVAGFHAASELFEQAGCCRRGLAALRKATAIQPD